MPAQPLLELRGEALDPAVHGRVVDLERMLADRGVEVDHTTMYRWVQRFAPELEIPPLGPGRGHSKRPLR